MSDSDSLTVWSEDRLVAYLWRDRSSPQGMGFRYTEDWVRNGGFAISQRLPLTTKEFQAEPGGTVQQFFANLLPEGGARTRTVRDRKIPDTDFDLLRAIGGDCAGALSILAIERKPRSVSARKYHLLSEEELRKLIMRRGLSYAGIPQDDRPRLSLAGAQDKCPVLFCDEQFYLPLQEAPSSHILKFEIPDYKNIPAYETFTTMLALSIGLPAVDVQLRKLKDSSYLCLARYDRYRDEDEKIHRLHQEDFCQALGYGYQYKYQEDGGPTFAQCYQLVQDASTDPAIDSQSLLRWHIFNVLAGNSDGHAKNLSLLYPEKDQTRLAPFYDLVCTRAMARIDENMAFSVGGERNPSIIRLQHWETEAQNCGIRPKFLQGLVKDSAHQLLENLERVRVDFESCHGNYPALQRVEKVIKKQCARALGEH
ncbi:MAG: type II toxin-antitoxin system HipA family toxin [Xanthomonadales bacterium]